MTPADIHWPPPICDACRDGYCEDCVLSTGCEHLECPFIYQEDAWPSA